MTTEPYPFEIYKLMNRVEDLEKRLAEVNQKLDVIEARRKRKPASSSKALVVKQTFVLTPTLSIELSDELLTSWADQYPKDFLREEWKSARSWILANPQKAPKSDWAKFFNTWFKRGWEKYRLTLKGQPAVITEDELRDMLRGQDAKRGEVFGGNEEAR